MTCLPRPALLLLPAAALLGGCAHPKTAEQIAQTGGLYNKFTPAAQTTIVGKTDAVDLQNAFAIVALSHAPFPPGSFLVARDANNVPTAVLETTRQVGKVSPNQGVMIVAGQLVQGYEVVEPGPELARLVQENIDKYLVDHSAPDATPAGPTPPAVSTASGPAASTATTPAADTAAPTATSAPASPAATTGNP